MERRYVVLGLSVVLALSLAVPALGGPSNPVAGISASAKKTAKAALLAANAAQSTANTALSTANSANTTANSANTKATAAQTTATAASAAAAAAQTTANSKWSTTYFEAGGATVVDSTEPKLAGAGCTGGTGPTEATGGGWTINTGTGGEDDIVMSINGEYGTGWLLQAEEIEPNTAQTWGITASAACGD